MKTLYDGTEVSDDTPTKNVSGLRYLLTQEEIEAREQEVSANQAATVAAHLPQYRFKREVGGVEYLGKTIQTDRETRANWIGILINAQSNPSYTVTWKTSDNSFAVYNAQEAIGAGLTVSGHVQKCFDAEAAIEGNTYNTIAEVEAAFESAYEGA